MSNKDCLAFRGCGGGEETSHDPGREEGDRGHPHGAHRPCPLSRHVLRREISGEHESQSTVMYNTHILRAIPVKIIWEGMSAIFYICGWRGSQSTKQNFEFV